MFNRLKGQSTLEYAMIVAVVVAGLFAMQIYMKRGVEGKLRTSMDDIGGQFQAGSTSVNTTTNRTGTTVENVTEGVTTIMANGTDGSESEKVTTSGNESVGRF